MKQWKQELVVRRFSPCEGFPYVFRFEAKSLGLMPFWISGSCEAGVVFVKNRALLYRDGEVKR